MTTAPDTAPSAHAARAKRRWLPWMLLGVIALVAGGAVFAAIELRSYADARHAFVNELTDIETRAVAQSSLVWRALTMKMANERMSFVRMRGEEQRARGEIIERVQALGTSHARAADAGAWLGHEPDPKRIETLEAAAMSFLGGVQSVFGQMTLSAERIRQRLRYWDINLGPFRAVLDETREHAKSIAADASRAAGNVTAFAALVTLLTSALFVLQLGRVRARRHRDLQDARHRATAASEARFRALVHHAHDLILVAEPDDTIRYASPSASALSNPARSPDAEPMGAEEAARDLTARRLADVFGDDAASLAADGTREVTVEAPGGATRIFEVHASDLSAHEAVGGVVVNAHEVTERKALEDRLRHQALHDPLTGLPNRRQFKRSYAALDVADRTDAAVCFIDLDGFKLVNDSYGHRVGDRLLVEAAARIRSCLGDGDSLARQGGDEFLVITRDADTAARILDALKPPFALDEGEAFVSASIGVVRDLRERDADDAVQRADIAMYRAKQTGKARIVEFRDDMLVDAPERLRLEADFRRALERGEFSVYYQPKVGLASDRIESLEALVRWEHPERGLVRPDVFISFAEETGLISELGRQILEQACRDAVSWQDRSVVVAVNLSPLQFRNPRLVEEVRDALEETGLDPALLELEITESAVLGDVDATIDVLDELKALGVRLAIDDFGTGYSNLSHLKHFKVDVLKIDQSFVRGGHPGTPDHLSDGAIVEAVIAMAKAFGLHVVAEGVETASHADELKTLGADLGQGYYFSKPVTKTEIDALLATEPAGARRSEK